MSGVQNPPLPPTPKPRTRSTNNKQVAFTTPSNYAQRLGHSIELKAWNPIWCPTLVVETNQRTKASIKPYLLLNPNPLLQNLSAIAFTSRTGISAFADALNEIQSPPLPPNGEIFTLAALGNDAELLNHDFISKICQNPNRVRVSVPPTATPSGLVESLGLGSGRRILCPVPLVVDIEEPPVIPNFLRDLASKGWVPVSVSAYETRWAGPHCAEDLVRFEGILDAIMFTSTGEVEGLLKSLSSLGFEWGMVKRRWPALLVAAHGPVTAAGAKRLGVEVDVVSSRFHSFDGVVEALAAKWGASDAGRRICD
eukprot:TRINITY_DN1271_c0_g1_i1.p1 TRINITY_DN1271_c0_g1~~TRINITY_DN1271_c0_g1_i1.p1  ORF type:complete len:310 (-),score=33.12 TRINITY_DN1271_c0_g1_i1:177-1106(-)